jgi:hypothetical protein
MLDRDPPYSRHWSTRSSCGSSWKRAHLARPELDVAANGWALVHLDRAGCVLAATVPFGDDAHFVAGQAGIQPELEATERVSPRPDLLADGALWPAAQLLRSRLRSEVRVALRSEAKRTTDSDRRQSLSSTPSSWSRSTSVPLSVTTQKVGPSVPISTWPPSPLKAISRSVILARVARGLRSLHMKGNEGRSCRCRADNAGDNAVGGLDLVAHPRLLARHRIRCRGWRARGHDEPAARLLGEGLEPADCDQVNAALAENAG